MKRLFTGMIICLLSIVVSSAQNSNSRGKYDPENIDIDPINKLAPSNKKVEKDDSIAVMTAEEVAVTASKRDVRKAKKILAEQEEVGRLTKDLVEQFKFQFEPYYCRYKTEYRSEGYLGSIRCYGGDFLSSLDIIPMNNQQYRSSLWQEDNLSDDYSLSGRRLYGSDEREKHFTNFDVEDIHTDDNEEDVVYFDVVIHQPVVVDGRSENLRYNFKLNYKNGKMACEITGDSRRYATYYGYLTTLR